MVNYKMIGFGKDDSDEIFNKGAEMLLRGLNIGKTLALKLGKEYDPPLIWNKNLPVGFAKILAEAVSTELQKNILFKPDEAFENRMRKELKKVVEKEV